MQEEDAAGSEVVESCPSSPRGDGGADAGRVQSGREGGVAAVRGPPYSQDATQTIEMAEPQPSPTLGDRVPASSKREKVMTFVFAFCVHTLTFLPRRGAPSLPLFTRSA